ncbi:MAG TPA: lysophospholipid acyltransferase family protein [Egibacteraceae bacterium]|nr:lysophospholipid acyltransferase family protein [Egibacteraceae bacterium]
MTQSTDAEIISLDPARRRAREGGGTARCREVVAEGRRCRNHAGPSGYCRVHEPEDADPPPAPTSLDDVAQERREADIDAAIEQALAFLRRRITGEYETDVFGFDRDLTEQVLLPLARPLYRKYWRVRTVGMEHVPAEGGALVVANHSGTLPFDAIMTKVALLDDHPAHRHLRELAADLALRLPFVGPLARKSGSTLAHGDDAHRLLANGELVGVWPEGFKGVGKLYRDRYKLQRFGRGGFVGVALRAQVPIIPVAIVGAEEIYPMLANVRWLARLGGFPYFPITAQFPLLGPLGIVPLPSKWVIDFGEPIDTAQYGPEAADDPMLVFELTDRVRDTIQQMLYRNLTGRRSVFF